jgi:cation:H+ antiporter
MPIIALVTGFVLLILSADLFTDNGVKIANVYKISPLIIGIIIFGFGTSAPEIFVSIFAAFQDHPELAVGNAFGSNILNIALVLGITAMIVPITVNVKAIIKQWYFLIAYTLITGALLLWDKHLSFLDGCILLGLLGLFLWFTFKESKKVNDKFDILSSKVDISQKRIIWRNLFISLVVLLVSAQLIVYAGVNIAEWFEVPDLIIGLTIVALGTSLPELAVAITSAIKRQHEMVVGNIIGSNIFNTVAVLAIPALISPVTIQDEITTDYLAMLALTISLAVFFRFSPVTKLKNTISRLEGFGLIMILSIYIYIRFLSP